MAFRRFRSGQALVLISLSLVVLLGFGALAVDIGLLYYTKRRMQTAADAGAVAAAQSLNNGGSYTTATQAAADIAKLDGFDNTAGTGVTVTATEPTISPYNTSSYVQVTISQPQPTYFLNVLGYSTVTVSTQAIGGIERAAGCIYALDPSANNTISVTGGSSMAADCGILDDSNATQALVSSGGSTVTASSIGVVGNYTGSGYTPTPKAGIAPVGDPLAYLQPPTVGACTQTNYNTPKPSATISYGTYCNGITVQGGATLYLNPGLYILNGGGLTVGGGSSIIGTGVTFYNTGSTTYAYKPIAITGTSTTSLTAPTTGTYEGILFFQDRNISSSQQNTISGTSSTVYQGALYFPTTPLVYSGGRARLPIRFWSPTRSRSAAAAQ